jgi:hypothetical protein
VSVPAQIQKLVGEAGFGRDVVFHDPDHPSSVILPVRQATRR